MLHYFPIIFYVISIAPTEYDLLALKYQILELNAEIQVAIWPIPRVDYFCNIMLISLDCALCKKKLKDVFLYYLFTIFTSALFLDMAMSSTVPYKETLLSISFSLLSVFH